MLRYWASVVVEAHKTTWAWLFGDLRRTLIQSLLFILATAVLYRWGRASQVTEQVAWLGAVVLAGGASYVPLTLFNFLRIPALKAHVASQEILRLKLATGETRDAPSFGLGLDNLSIDERMIDQHYEFSRYGRDHFPHTQNICRIWVKNLTDRPVAGCRLVVEKFCPEASIRAGDALVRHFDLAGTETKYFTFLTLSTALLESSDEGKDKLYVLVNSEKHESSFDAALHPQKLDYGIPYSITVAVHGQGANSARLNMVVEAVSEREVHVTEAECSAPPSAGQR